EVRLRAAQRKKTFQVGLVRQANNEAPGQPHPGLHFRYFFYVTNDRDMSQQQVVSEANHRCDQENLISQLKSGTRALHAPVNTLEANWAYMVMASLAWTLKAWFALLLPVAPRWRDAHEQDRRLVLRMDFRSFLDNLILIPAQIIRSARRTIFRISAWRRRIDLLFRLLHAI